MWVFVQKSGELLLNDAHIGFGYSGAYGGGYNNPDMQEVHDEGPIPQGGWTIEGPPVDTPKHGPYVLRLTPKPKTDTFQRSGFLCHGDTVGNPGHASEGCIILARFIRERIWNSGDRDLLVVAESPNASSSG